jgi:hypothetical protein
MTTDDAPGPVAAARPLDGRLAFGLAVGLTLLVHLTPVGALLGRPLTWFAVLIHELGHGVGALLAGGEFRAFVMSDSAGAVSGVAQVVTFTPTQGAVAVLAGLLGPSVAAMIGFALARSPRWARVGLAVIATFLIWALAFKVRSWFGAAVVGGLIGITGAGALLASARMAQLLLMFLSVELALSLWSHLGYMFSRTAALPTGVVPSDSASLAAQLGGAYWMWGALAALLSLAAIALGALLIVRDRRRRAA